MISVSDAARFAQENVSSRKFKPFWEAILDYVILGLLLLTLFSWAKVITADASGLLCKPIDSKIGYSFTFAKYFNSLCAQDFEDKLLLYYPYLLFVLWLLLTLIQRLWLKIPAVRCRFESYHKLYADLIKFKSQTTSSLEESSDANFVVEMRQKLSTIIGQNDVLVKAYTTKCFLLTIITTTALFSLSYWISKQVLFQTNFHCNLETKLPFTPVSKLICNFTAAQFLYVIILISIGLQAIVNAICLYGLYWSISKQWLKKSTKILSCSEYKGNIDLQFSLGLLKCSFPEQHAISEAFNLCQQIEKPSCSSEIADENTDFICVKWIADHLGLSIIPSTIGDDKSALYECLEKILQTRTFEKRIDEHVSESSIEKLNEISLETFADKLLVNIIIVHCYSPYEIREIYRPISSDALMNIPSYFITYVRPHFFHMTKAINLTETSLERRTRYICDVDYRNKLRHSIVLNLKTTSHKTNDKFENRERNRRPICKSSKCRRKSFSQKSCEKITIKPADEHIFNSDQSLPTQGLFGEDDTVDTEGLFGEDDTVDTDKLNGQCKSSKRNEKHTKHVHFKDNERVVEQNLVEQNLVILSNYSI